MYRNVWLSLVIAVLLAGCGASPDQTTDDQLTGANHSEATQTVQEKENTAEKREAGTPSESESDSGSEPNEASDSAEQDNSNETASTALSDLDVHYIDVGQADASLLQYQESNTSYNILFDTGDWRGNEVVNYLSSQNVSSIDLLIVSHADADHAGQLEEVVNTFEVGEVWMPGNGSSSDTFQQGLEAVMNSGSSYEEPRTGDDMSVGPMDVTVLYPDSISGDTNAESIAAKFTYGDTSFLFTGDADRNAEEEMLTSDINVDADILQLGHHGSDTSSAPAFINEVNPETAVYSAGADNQYGHPHAEVVSLIQDEGINLYGTDVHGTIVITSDGNDYTIQTGNDGTISPESTDNSGNNTATDDTNNNQSAADESTQSSGDCININEASAQELQEITQIGPARAEDLINLRPFQSVDGLSRISGIADSRIADIKSQGLACTGG